MSPVAAKRCCATPGCPVLVERGHCAAHRKQQGQAKRELDDPRYRTRRWTAYSQQFKVLHPLCARCPRLTEVTDHIVPPWVAPERFFDETNHQPLCASCNRLKGDEDAKLYG